MDDFKNWQNMEARPFGLQALSHFLAERQLYPAFFAPHRSPGFYKALSDVELAASGYPVAELNTLFVVPADCGRWHKAEREKSGTLIRFFASRAWFGVSKAEGTKTLRVELKHAVTQKAADSLYCVARSAQSGKAFAEKQGLGVWDIDVAGESEFWLTFTSSDQAIPASLYPGNPDGRLLSAAVTLPISV